MPPWSARNNPLSNPPNSQHPHHHFASPPQSQSRLQQSTPRALPQDVPILPSRPVASNPMLAMASSSSSPRQRRGHTRSISHPFNGVLSGRGVGKKHNRTISKDVLMDSDDDDDGNPYEFTFTPMPLSPSPKKQLPRTPPVDGAEDFATGRCLTCSTMMRWPKNLSTFRCTECLMVNDLEVPGDNGKPAVPRKAIPISFDRTKGIIDNCIASYLRKLLEAPETRPLPIKAPGSSRLGQSPNRGNGYLSDCSSGDPQSRTPSGPSSPTRPKPGASSYPTTYQTQSLFPPSQGLPPRGRSNSDMQSSPNPGQAKPFVTEPKEPTNSNRPTLFRPVEDYIISSFKACDCLNVSFSTAQQPPQSGRDASPSKPMPDTPGGAAKVPPKGPVRPPDLGNGHSREKSTGSTRPVTSRSPRINWAELAQWYHLILTAGVSWVELWSAMQPADVYNEEDALRKRRWDTVDLTAVDREIADARFHLQRTLLKATENLLKRPRQPLRRPEDTRFLLMLLANPMLYPSSSLPGVQAAAVMPHKDKLEPPNARDRDRPVPPNGKQSRKEQPMKQRSRGPGGHSGIIKRIMGLISSLPNEIHHYLISWFSRFSVGQFERIVDLVGGFFTYRLTRQHGRKQTESFRTDDSLIPSFSSAAGNTPAELHAAINGRNQSKSNKSEDKPTVYGDDWQILAACRVMSLLFSANNAGGQRKPDEDLDDPARRNQVINRGHLIPISSFYNTLLDYSDLVADFEGWESKTSRFSFCQYPFFLSIWAKIHILEHDARRQMEVRAREAFFSSILSRKAVSQYLVLKVRRDCLVEDSLKRISEVVWNSQQEIKKGLRVEFLGEEGVDAGGLRKEWFLLLVRDVFDPNHGLFIYDEDSQYCYFNPFCFESSEQFFLVGVLLGLAIYNSTILDIALPPFAFRKLLAAAPVQQNGPSSSSAATPRTGFKSTLDDLAEYRPALAKGLRGLLEFEGDVAETFCYDFVAQLDRYGERVAVPLCEGGEKRQVTNANRREFVDLYVQQLLDVSVTRQFQPFKRGFFTVCGGNALSLFRSEEIELLVRGSDEPLDVPSLKAVASYDNWPSAQPEKEPVVQWFWEFFENTQPASQRKILSFITGSDRIPAMGATSLSIRMTCLGDDASRYPTARTCFNMLGLYRYPTRERLERVLWEAVMNGEGFGLK